MGADGEEIAPRLQVKHNPYFSHGDRELVIAEHDAKCATDPLHIAIEADILALRSKNTRSGIKQTRFFDPKHLAKGSAVDAAILAALDYNSVRCVATNRSGTSLRLSSGVPHLALAGGVRHARVGHPRVLVGAHVRFVPLHRPPGWVLHGGPSLSCLSRVS